MERQLFFLIIALGALWLILDDFNGKRRITAFAKGVLSNA